MSDRKGASRHLTCRANFHNLSMLVCHPNPKHAKSSYPSFSCTSQTVRFSATNKRASAVTFNAASPSGTAKYFNSNNPIKRARLGPCGPQHSPTSLATQSKLDYINTAIISSSATSPIPMFPDRSSARCSTCDAGETSEPEM